MSVSYDMKVIVGMQIPETWLFNDEQNLRFRCKHEYPENAKYCPICGVETEPYYVYFRDGTKEAFDFFDVYDIDDLYDSLYNSKIFINEIEMSYSRNNCGEEFLIAGMQIAHFGDPRFESTYSLQKIPRIPSEKEIKQALEKYSIPYREDSYGLHLICVGF